MAKVGVTTITTNTTKVYDRQYFSRFGRNVVGRWITSLPAPRTARMIEHPDGYDNSHDRPTVKWEIRDGKGILQALHIRFDRDGEKSLSWRLPGAQDWGLKGRKLESLPLYRS